MNKHEETFEKALKVLERTGMKRHLRTEEDYEPFDYEGNKVWVEIDYREPFCSQELSGYGCVCINLTKKEVSVGSKKLHTLWIIDRDSTLNAIALFVNRVDNLGQEIAKELNYKFVG